jgi:putative Se/S carrier protein
MNRILVFDTTHHAMWAEEVARENSIAADVVPAPPGTDAKCGLALEVRPEGFDSLLSALNSEGVPHRVFR